MPKDQLALLNNTDNIFSFPQATIDAYKLDASDTQQISDTVKLYLNKVKDHFAYKMMVRQQKTNFNHFDFVMMPKYPLPAAFNKTTKKIIINFGTFGRKQAVNIAPQDMYAVMVYGYVATYYTYKNLKPNMIDDISDYVAGLFIRMFAKKYGLLGSYAEEIPKLRFLVTAYVIRSYFDIPQNQAFTKASRLAQIKPTEFDIDLNDYDFYNVRDFIKVLSESGVLHGITLYEFASAMIRSFGSVSLPMFEDGMRFMATLAGGSVTTNSVFPIFLQKYHPTLYNKILASIQRSIS